MIITAPYSEVREVGTETPTYLVLSESLRLKVLWTLMKSASLVMRESLAKIITSLSKLALSEGILEFEATSSSKVFSNSITAVLLSLRSICSVLTVGG